MHRNDPIDELVARWDKMAEAWNEGMSKTEAANNKPRVNEFVRFANHAGSHLREAAKICNIDIGKDAIKVCHDCPYWDFCKERLGGERHKECPAPHLSQAPERRGT